VQLHVDSSKCQGHARCNAVGPQLFELDDLGYVLPRSAPVPQELEAMARKGVAACPERALTVS
jgi:ferredoxin